MHIISLSSSTADEYHVDDLQRASVARGHTLTACSWRRACATVAMAGSTARVGEVALDEADVVLPRTMPAGSLEQIVFRMDLLHRLQAGGVRVVNGPTAIETSVDKYLALWRMADAGLNVPPTTAAQTAAEAHDAFNKLGGDVIIKPLFGSQGVGMTRISDPQLAFRAFTLLERMGSVIYLQKFISHNGDDLRLFVLGDEVIASMRRSHHHWCANVARGAVGERYEPNEQLVHIALTAAKSCHAEVAGVDILIDTNGEPYVIEVNAVPGWQALAPVTGIDIADRVITYLESKAYVHA